MKKWRVAVLDMHGDVMEETTVEARNVVQALGKVAYGREYRIRVLVCGGDHEISIMREDVLEVAMQDHERVGNLAAA